MGFKSFTKKKKKKKTSIMKDAITHESIVLFILLYIQ